LRRFGAVIGQGVHIYPTVRISIPWNLNLGDQSAVGDGAILYALGTITLRESCTISQYVHVCAGSHDYSKSDRPLTKPPITIGAGAWVCADAFIGPDVLVGDGAIVGARTVVVKDVPANVMIVGNPAKVVREL